LGLRAEPYRQRCSQCHGSDSKNDHPHCKSPPYKPAPYIISAGEFKIARFSFCYNLEHSLPDGRAISAAIMAPYGFLSKAKAFGTAAVAGSRIDVKRLIVLRPIKNKMETRPDDNKIHMRTAPEQFERHHRYK
jgi:hypothetical protein